jgi:endonuclease/exonuclease/phosphatase family metal-dependent hydrolase
LLVSTKVVKFHVTLKKRGSVKKIFLLILALASFSLLADSNTPTLTVMNFNTMCDVCGNRANYGSFKQRLVAMADTINRHNPDLVSLQEFSTKREVQRMLKMVSKSYLVFYAKKKYWSYTDPVLLVSKERFDVQQNGGFWLGPNTRLPFGWKLAIPRRLEWVKLKDKIRQEELVFVGTHFDNNSGNKIPSASLTNDFINLQNTPVIFAGDSNIKAYDPGYNDLLGDTMLDTFPTLNEVVFHNNSPYVPSDACNKSKAETFPKCRIDHVLISKSGPWQVISWAVDLFRYHGNLGFVSDHRAVIVTLD